MGNAGYGNHEEDAEVGERASPAGATAGTRPVPDSAGAGSRSGKRDPAPPTRGDDTRDESTPGAGALPSGSPHGGDVDPGAG